MPVRPSLYLPDTLPLHEALRHAQYAEGRGFEAIWQPEIHLGRDALVSAAAYAGSTSHTRIGLAALQHWTRHPAGLAAALMTLDDLAPDRVMVALAGGTEGMFTALGARVDKPLLALRETLTALRALLAWRKTNLVGEYVQVRDVQLTAAVGRASARQIGFYIAATGPKLLALAGEIADGALLPPFVSASYTQSALEVMEKGTRQAGRPLLALERPQVIACAVSADRGRALEVARRWVTLYMARQPTLFRASGVPQELLDEIGQVLPPSPTADQVQAAMRLVPDEVVDLVTATGSPEVCRARVREYLAAGATAPVLLPLLDDVHGLIDAFAGGF